MSREMSAMVKDVQSIINLVFCVMFKYISILIYVCVCVCTDPAL